MLGSIYVLALFGTVCQGLTFLSPAPLAVGPVYSSMFKQVWPFASTTIFGSNVTVQIAADYFGCNPSLQSWSGKVAWYANGPCGGLSNPFVSQWLGFKAAGAVGIITTILGSSVDQTTSQLFTGGTLSYPAIPVIGIKFIGDIFSDYSSPTNPPIGLFLFGLPANANITARFDAPSVDYFTLALTYSPSAYGFVVFFGETLGFIALAMVAVKLTLFISLEGVKFSIPQIVLALSGFASFICLFQMLWGPLFASVELSYGPGAFFQSHFLPYWYAAIAVFSFYLVEVSVLTQSKISGLDKFKIPAAIVCATLLIIEIIVGSIFAAFPATVNFTQVITLLACIYIICANLMIILLGIATFLLIRAMMGSSNLGGQSIRFGITSFLLACMLEGSCLFCIFIAQGLRGISPQWGEFSPLMGGLALIWWTTFLATILLASGFRVSLQKEIEISKSGTSSTSSSGIGSSKESGTSSSSRADPVIEL